MKHYRQMLALLLCLFLLPVSAWAESEKLPLQAVHQVELNQKTNKQMNGSTIYLWQIKTAQEAVSKELNAIAQAYADEIGPAMKKPASDNYSWLYVTIRHSRTGLNWMSFMVQSRYIYHKETQDVRFTTRTYDMSTGEEVRLTDVFPADSEAWEMLQSAVQERVNAYYPDLAPDSAALEAACTREAIEQMDFTLHGMSLVLHLHAADFYPGKAQLIEVPLYYPQIRPMMTEKAQVETDNLTYYNTVALTYDDGPNGWITRDMLNVLLQAGERATFFMVGERMRGYAYLVHREHDEGHAVATHNYLHVLADEVTEERLHQLADKVNEVHIELLGIAPDYARAPGGVWWPMADAKLGWPLLQWTTQASDWEGEDGRDPYKVAAQIVADTGNGDIILMHDMKKNSIAATEMFIRTLQKKGFIFLTIDELFAKDGMELQPDTVYYRCLNGVTSDY